MMLTHKERWVIELAAEGLGLGVSEISCRSRNEWANSVTYLVASDGAQQVVVKAGRNWQPGMPKNLTVI